MPNESNDANSAGVNRIDDPDNDTRPASTLSIVEALEDAVQYARNSYMLFHDENWKARLDKWESALKGTRLATESQVSGAVKTSRSLSSLLDETQLRLQKKSTQVVLLTEAANHLQQAYHYLAGMQQKRHTTMSFKDCKEQTCIEFVKMMNKILAD